MVCKNQTLRVPVSELVSLVYYSPNLCVRDIEAMVHFLQTAFPEFRMRGEGIRNDGTRWVHVGTDETYIALGQSRVDPAKH